MTNDIHNANSASSSASSDRAVKPRQEGKNGTQRRLPQLGTAMGNRTQHRAGNRTQHMASKQGDWILKTGLGCAPPHPPLTYGNILGTKPAILNQPTPHHIQFPSYNGKVMKNVFIIGSGWMGSEVQHLSPELLVSSCVCEQEHTDKPANFNFGLN